MTNIKMVLCGFIYVAIIGCVCTVRLAVQNCIDLSQPIHGSNNAVRFAISSSLSDCLVF